MKEIVVHVITMHQTHWMYSLRVSEVNEVPISSHIWVGPSTLKSLRKNLKKLKLRFITYLGLAESFKPMNRS